MSPHLASNFRKHRLNIVRPHVNTILQVTNQCRKFLHFFGGACLAQVMDKLDAGVVVVETCSASLTKGRFSRHPKCFSNKPLWSDVQHCVVTIATHLGQGRLWPVVCTGQPVGEGAAYAVGALPCTPWRWVRSPARASLRRRESPQAPARHPQVWREARRHSQYCGAGRAKTPSAVLRGVSVLMARPW